MKASLVIELAKGNFHEARAVELARLASELRDVPPVGLIGFITLIRRHEVSGRVGDRFLLEIWQHLEMAEWPERTAVVEALVASLRERRSGLSEGRTWKALGLPGGLLETILPSS